MGSHTTVIAVVNLKGGAGKTTTAGHVAQALVERGWRVLALDGDPQGSLFAWSEAVGFAWSCAPFPSGQIHRELPGIIGDDWDAVVIDTPPTEHGKQITLSAVRAATHVLIPVAPAAVEHQRLAATRELLADAADLDAEFEHGVMLVKVDGRAAAGRYFRDLMTSEGWRVLRAQAPDLQRYIQAVGAPILRARASGYGDAVAELLGLEA